MLKTTDGGDTWVPITRGLGNIYETKISILSKDIIFDYIYSVFGGKAIFKSIDGGSTWEELTLPAELDDVLSIEFINEQDGFIRENGDRDTFYKTIDGGNTWSKVEVTGSSWEDIVFVSKDLIYTFIDNKLSKSTDGGVSWINIGEELPLSVDYLFNVNEKIYISSFGRANLFVLENDNIEQLVGLHTGTLNIANYKKPYFDGENFNSIHIQNYISDSDDLNYVYMSFDKDGRGSKYTRTNIVADSYNDFSTYGISTSPSGSNQLTYPNPFRAVDTNLNWEQLFDLRYTMTRFNFEDIKFINEEEAIAIEDGKIYKTEDKGDNWSIVSQLSDEFTVVDTELFSENEVRVLGDTYFHKTIDGGENWTSVTIPNLVTTSNWLRKIYSFNENLIWAYGDLSTVIRSTDGGLTWNTIEFDEINGVSNINFINENEGFVSYLDDVYVTYDGGNSWNLSTGDNIGLNRVYSHFTDEHQGWLWEENRTFRYLQNPITPIIASAISDQINENEYSVSIDWSLVENATHYKITLLFLDPFDNEEILSEGVTTSSSHTFPLLDINNFPFLNDVSELKVRVVAANYQNKSLVNSDNLTSVAENGSLSSDNLIIDQNYNLIYPNPVDTELNIDSNKEIKQSIVYSLNGKKMKFTEKLNTVDVSDLSSGVYIIKIIYYDGSISNNKFVKK